MDAKIKTEGQRLLVEMEGSETDLAARAGCSPATVGAWRRGNRAPGKTARHKLELLVGIPRRAWGVAPGAPVPTDDEPDDAHSDDGTLQITKKQITSILHELDNDDLTEAETAKLRDTVGKLLALRARLERDQELLEDRIVREHPEWQRLKAAILRSLEPYPEAAKAVAEAIE